MYHKINELVVSNSDVGWVVSLSILGFSPWSVRNWTTNLRREKRRVDLIIERYEIPGIY